MNDVQCLINRQLGLNFELNYDNVLKRLVVTNEESFYGLQNSNAVPNLEQDPPIFACRFAEASGYEHILALANEDGTVAIQNTFSAKTAQNIESFQCHNNAVFDLAWMPGHMKFVTVSGDHTARLWDAGQGAPRQELVLAGHSRSVKTAAFRPGHPAQLATGGRDGHVLLWDARCPPAAPAALVTRPEGRLAACHGDAGPPRARGRPPPAPRALSITGLAFRDDRLLLSSGEGDGTIKGWDLRRSYCGGRPLPARCVPYGGGSARRGYCDLLVDAARQRLYASCMDHVVYCFDVGSCAPAPLARYAGHEAGSFYVKLALSPDGRYLASGSSDKCAYVWSVRGAEPLVRLAGHRAEVTCAAWSRRHDTELVTCSDDARHCVWRVGPEEPGAALAGRAEPPVPAAPAPAPGPPRCKRPATPPPAAPGAADVDAKRPRLELTPRGVKRPHPDPEDAECEAEGRPPGSPPTRGLPDWVQRGEAPHLRLMSPPRRSLPSPGFTCAEWLSRARALTPPAPPPAPTTGPLTGPRCAPETNKRRRTLLHFFPVTPKDPR